MRRGWLKALVLLIAGITIGAGGVMFLRPTLHGPPLPPATAGLSEAEVAMERPVPEVWMEGVPLDEAIDRLRPLAGVPVDVDWRALETAGISRTAPVAVRCRNARMGDVLSYVLDPLGTPGARVGAAADGSRIFVSTGDVLERRLVVRSYDVRDLVDPGRTIPAHTTLGLFDGIQIPAEDMPDAMERLIWETIAPSLWRGELVGAAHYIDGRIIVAQTTENHRLIRILLEQLRTAPAPPHSPTPPEPGRDVQRWDDRLGRWVSTDPTVVDAALRRTIPDLALDADSLEQAVDQLRGVSGANIWVDRVAFDSIWPPAPSPARIKVRLHEVTLAEALRAVLDAVGRDLPLTWWCDGAVITLTNRETASRHLVTETYDVRDWLRAEGVSVLTSPVEDAILSKWDTDRAPAAERLAAAVRQAVAPDSWWSAGGRIGTIREVAGHLVVTQTWENQEHVRRFLHAISVTRASKRGDAAEPATRPETATTRPAGDEP